MRRAHCLLLLALLAVVHTAPLSLTPGSRSLNHNADAQLLEWTLAWIAHAAQEQPTRMFDGNMFAPEAAVLAYTDPLLVPGLIGAPLAWLGASPVLNYNLVQMAGLVLTAWAGWFVAWRWTGSMTAALTGGALAAFNAHVFARLPHVQAAHAWMLPLVLYLADRLIDRPSRRTAAGLAFVVAVTAATSLYTLTFAGLIVGVVAALGLGWGRWRGALTAAGASVAGLALAAPVLWPYAELGRAGLSRPLEMVAEFSATPGAYLSGLSHVDRWLTGATGTDERQVLFAGVVPLVLAAIGAVAMSRRSRDVHTGASRRRLVTVLVLGALATLLSLGPATPVYRALYDWAPPVRGIRAVARFGSVYLVSIALLAAAGVAWMQAKVASGRAGLAVALAALALVSAESWTGPIRTEPFTRIPPIYQVLADDPRPVLLVEVPFFPPDAMWGNGEYVLNAASHWRPIMNGYSGFTPDSYRRRADAFWFFPEGWALDAMVAEGATHVMVHLERFDPAERANVASTLPALRGLRLVASDGLGHRLYEVVRR